MSLERRLDNVIFRLGFAPSRPAARQLVSHSHVLVNGKKVNIPSYKLVIGDTVSIDSKGCCNSRDQKSHGKERY